MYGASCCKIGLVEVADESEGSYEVGGGGIRCNRGNR